MKSISYLIDILKMVIPGAVGYVLGTLTEKWKRKRDIKDLVLGFIIEIKQIKEEIQKQQQLSQPEKNWLSMNVLFTYDVPEILGKYYRDNISRKGMIGDEVKRGRTKITL